MLQAGRPGQYLAVKTTGIWSTLAMNAAKGPRSSGCRHRKERLGEFVCTSASAWKCARRCSLQRAWTRSWLFLRLCLWEEDRGEQQVACPPRPREGVWDCISEKSQRLFLQFPCYTFSYTASFSSVFIRSLIYYVVCVPLWLRNRVNLRSLEV